jgi:predicted GIY-YIG superfamily endonuclease
MSTKDITEKTIDIVELVKNHPLNKLPIDDTSVIVNKIKEKFPKNEQQLFIANFYCYLNYDKNKDFVIDLDNMWKWLGFERKGKAKELLVNNFKENEDYKVENLASPTGEARLEQHGGHNKEIILLTIYCFKKLCLKAKTKKSDEIHDYYISLEEMINEVVYEQSEQLRNQLLISNTTKQTIVDNNEDNLLFNFDKKHVVYVCQIDDNTVRFGYSDDIKTRLKNHKSTFGKDLRLVYIFESVYNVEVESLIKKDIVISKKIIKGENNNPHTETSKRDRKTELIQLDENFTINDLKKRIEEIRKTCSNDQVAKLTKECDDLTIENEILINENNKLKEELEESNKEIQKLVNTNKIMTKKGYIEKTFDNCTCSRCGRVKDVKEFNINKVSNRPKSVCKICEEFNIEKYNDQNKERIELEIKECIEKEENLKKHIEDLLSKTHLINCTRCNDDKSVKEIGVNLRTGDYYKICEICRDKQMPKTKTITKGEIPSDGETCCSKCKNNFESTINTISRTYYKTCQKCRELDKKNAKKDKENLKGCGISKCIYCTNEFEPELTKKKDGYLKSCFTCREKRKVYEKTRNKDKRLLEKKEYYENNKTIIRQKQKEYYSQN